MSQTVALKSLFEFDPLININKIQLTLNNIWFMTKLKYP